MADVVSGNRSPADADPAAVAQLGPVVLEQRGTQAVAVLFILVGGLCAALGMALAWFAEGPQRTALLWTGVGLSIFGWAYLIAGIYRGWSYRGFELYLHERGIRQRRAGHESLVPFERAESVEYQSIRAFMHGTYAGTVERLTVRTGPAAADRLYFQRKWQEQTGMATGYVEASPVAQIAQNISASIARRLAAQLERGETIPWTSRMQIGPMGLSLSGKRWYERELSDLFDRPGARGWEQVPWEGVERIDVVQGFLHIWRKGDHRHRLRVSTGEPNFQAGYALAAARLEQRSVADAPKPAAPELKAGNQAENISLRFSWTLADHLARDRYINRAFADHRRDRRVQVLVPSGIVTGFACFFLILAVSLHRISLGWFLIGLALTALGTLALGLLIGLAVTASDRRRVTRELLAAQKLAMSGKVADPLVEHQVVLGPPGYALKNRYSETKRRWSEVARVEFSEGYIFLHAAATKTDRERVEMMIPPRACGGPLPAQTAFDRIHDWHARANRG